VLFPARLPAEGDAEPDADAGATPATASAPAYLHDIDQFVDALEPALWPLNCFIHDNPELGYAEYKAHDALTSFMSAQGGWRVTRSAYGMDTAWSAVYDTGRPGPVVSFNAEMDALPALGHACGHNLIAVASVAAGLATAKMLSRHHLPGKVLVIGTPAEEGGGGKIKCLEAGAYTGVDVSIISHPGIYNNSPMVRTTAFVHLKASYVGRAAHGANSPWAGVNALDALVLAYNAVSALRQQTRPDDIIGLQITDGGGRPNVIHAHAAGVAVLRASSTARLRELQRKVEACFRAGAEATGAKLEIEAVPGYMDHVPNRVLAESFRRHWQALPNVPDPPLPPPGQFTWVKASTDQGNLSYALPSMNVSFAIPPGAAAGPPHSPDFEKASATTGAYLVAMRVAKGMAGAAVDVCAVPGLLDEVKRQWRYDMGQQNGS
jgi:amidohydrolase